MTTGEFLRVFDARVLDRLYWRLCRGFDGTKATVMVAVSLYPMLQKIEGGE